MFEVFFDELRLVSPSAIVRLKGLSSTLDGNLIEARLRDSEQRSLVDIGQLKGNQRHRFV